MTGDGAVRSGEGGGGPAGPPERPGRRAVGPIVFLVIFVIAVLAIFWGRFVANPKVEVFYFQAGPLETLQPGEVMAFEDLAMYVVVLDEREGEKQVRAIDGIVKATGCAVVFDPEDTRAANENPGGRPGSFTDPCSGARWATNGNAVSGTSTPLRVPQITRVPNEDGQLFVDVEVIGRSDPREFAPEE